MRQRQYMLELAIKQHKEYVLTNLKARFNAVMFNVLEIDLTKEPFITRDLLGEVFSKKPERILITREQACEMIKYNRAEVNELDDCSPMQVFETYVKSIDRRFHIID